MAASDEELVARVVATGDHRAFGEIMRRHQASVRGWLRHLTRDPDLADELAQVTFIRAWRKLERFSGQGSLRGWLMRVAYRVLIDEQRSRQRIARLGAALENEGIMQEASSAPVAEAPDLPRMMAILSDAERTVMILCHAFGCSHSEASDLTGMPLGTIKSHLSRASERIRKQFGIEV